MSTATLAAPAAAAPAPEGGGGGLTGAALGVVEALGSPGVGLLSFLEVVFPPIPSEVVLPLAGYLVAQGRVGLVAVLVLSSLGSLAGSLVLYALGRRIGIDRTARLADRIPLVDGDDVHRSARWFSRHSSAAVFTGRFVPGIRSLVSLPAGAARMPLGRFVVLTLVGSALWNAALVGAGMALGTQHALVERYSGYVDVAFYAAGAALLVWAVARRVRRNLRGNARTPDRS